MSPCGRGGLSVSSKAAKSGMCCCGGSGIVRAWTGSGKKVDQQVVAEWAGGSGSASSQWNLAALRCSVLWPPALRLAPHLLHQQRQRHALLPEAVPVAKVFCQAVDHLLKACLHGGGGHGDGQREAALALLLRDDLRVERGGS